LSPEDTSEEVAEEIKADIGAADGIFEDASELASEEDDALSPTTLDEEVEYKVYVGSLPFTVTADEVRKIFEDNSSVAIKSVSLPVNNDRVDEATGMPMSKGFAFVSVESEEDIEKAISAMNGFEIDGRTLRVNKLLSKDQMENMKSKRNMVPDGTSLMQDMPLFRFNMKVCLTVSFL
jgi:RNA recognition motif-containing protein